MNLILLNRIKIFYFRIQKYYIKNLEILLCEMNGEYEKKTSILIGLIINDSVS